MRLAYRTPIVFLARHATPDWNRRDIPYDIPPGPPLTPQGEDEARSLGDFLKSQGVVRLYHSPLERTRRTADIAAQMCSAESVESLAIAEWRRDENETAVLGRMLPFWQQVCAESAADGPIALVTHGGCVLAMLNWLQHPQDEINHIRNQCDHRNPLPPAAAWLTTPRGHDGPVFATAPSAWQARLAFSPRPLQPFLLGAAAEIAYV